MSTKSVYEVQCFARKHGWDSMSTRDTLADARAFLKQELTLYPPEPGERFRIVKVTITITTKREIVK